MGVYMNIYMYVIRELEDALDDCGSTCTLYNCNDDPVQAWDKGVAFYTGSLQGSNAGPGFGNLFYALADKRCKYFQTCGSNSDSTSGGSYVNQEIFQEFVVGQYNLLNGQCEEARKNKENIVKLMNIPLIQSTLRYAYKQEIFQLIPRRVRICLKKMQKVPFLLPQSYLKST